MSTIEILVPHPKCSKYSLKLSKLTQTRAWKSISFLPPDEGQKVFSVLHSCTDSLPTQRDRKIYFSGACLWVDFPNTKEFLHHLIQRTYFYMIELHFWFLVLLSLTLLHNTSEIWSIYTRLMIYDISGMSPSCVM